MVQYLNIRKTTNTQTNKGSFKSSMFVEVIRPHLPRLQAGHPHQKFLPWPHSRPAVRTHQHPGGTFQAHTGCQIGTIVGPVLIL